VFIDFILCHFFFAVTSGYKNKYTKQTVYIKFLVLQLDSHLNWKDHIDQMIPKLSAASYAVRLMFHVSNIITLKSIYFAYFQSIMLYGIIWWGGGGILPTVGRCLLHKRKPSESWLFTYTRTTCRSLSKKSEILPIPYQYIPYVIIDEFHC
jgi:hypothetical protein